MGEGDKQGVCRHGDGAVEVFAGVFDAGRDAVFFEVVFHDQPGVIAGTAGDDVDLPRAREGIEQRRAQAREVQFAVAEAAFEGVGDGGRLFEDFFLHVVFVAAFAGEVGALFAFAFGAGDGGAARVVNLVAVFRDARAVVFLHGDEAAGDGQKGVDVGGGKVFADTEADDHRRAVAGGDDFVGAVGGEHGDGISAAQTGGGGEDSGVQVVAVMAVDEMRDDFGVGIAVEGVAARAQFVADFLVVFDDAVMDDSDALATHMRVGILLAWHAVRRPAGVGNAAGAADACFLRFGDKARHFANGAAALDAATVTDGESGRVIAAIFEAFQAFKQDGGDIAFGDAGDDSAHGVFSLGVSDGRAI